MQVTFHAWDDSTLARYTAAALGPAEVQVWTAAVPADEAVLTALAGLLSPAERDRAASFRVSEPRHHFVFGRALVRQLLGACLRVEPAAVTFGYQPHGKPFLAQSGPGGDLRFNLAHSGRLVAVALTRGREVGVDIESIHHLSDWPLLAERIFSPRELAELRALPAPQQQAAFFNGWTRKEAYLKATGAGLTDALAAIEVTLAPDTNPELLALPAAPETARRWAIRAIPLPPGFAGAVVFETD